MREFVKGWKRKVGVLTLLLACVFVAGWVRTKGTYDSIELTLVGRHHSFISDLGYIRWQAYDDDSSLEFRWESTDVKKNVARLRIENSILPHLMTSFWKFEIPYWSITIPLTLLSAYPLLTKPRKPNPKKSDELVPTEGP